MKNKYNYGLIITIIFLLITQSGCISQQNSTKESEYEHIHYLYQIEIISNRSVNYYLYIPIPIKPNGNSSKILDDLEKINGNGTMNIIKTRYGIAMNVSGNNNLLIKSEGNEILDLIEESNSSYFPSIYLSLYSSNNNSKNSFWIYCYKEKRSINITLNIILDIHIRKSTNEWCRKYSEINNNMKLGWQKVESKGSCDVG